MMNAEQAEREAERRFRDYRAEASCTCGVYRLALSPRVSLPALDGSASVFDPTMKLRRHKSRSAQPERTIDLQATPGKLQLPTMLCYHGSIMKKREGVTEKISISLSRSDLASLKKRAKRLYAGNVSAVISELAADAALLEGMHELVGWLGGPSLTDRERKAIDREWAAQTGAPKRARKSKKAA